MRITPLLLTLPALLLANCMNKKTTAALTPVEMSQDYRVRHPILVSPAGARLPHKCGQWDEDLGAQGHSFNKNTQYWNYGCATQHNLAAMIANPNDLLQPRGLGESNARRRQEILDKYQKGTDPTIQWKIEDKNKTATGVGGG